MSSRTLPAFPSKNKLNAEMQHGKTWRTSKPFGAAPTFVSKKTRNAYCVEPEVVELTSQKAAIASFDRCLAILAVCYGKTHEAHTELSKLCAPTPCASLACRRGV